MPVFALCNTAVPLKGLFSSGASVAQVGREDVSSSQDPPRRSRSRSALGRASYQQWASDAHDAVNGRFVSVADGRPCGRHRGRPPPRQAARHLRRDVARHEARRREHARRCVPRAHGASRGRGTKSRLLPRRRTHTCLEPCDLAGRPSAARPLPAPLSARQKKTTGREKESASRTLAHAPLQVRTGCRARLSRPPTESRPTNAPASVRVARALAPPLSCRVARRAGMNNSHLGVVSVLGAIGFTMCLLLTEARNAGRATGLGSSRVSDRLAPRPCGRRTVPSESRVTPFESRDRRGCVVRITPPRIAPSEPRRATDRVVELAR